MCYLRRGFYFILLSKEIVGSKKKNWVVLGNKKIVEAFFYFWGEGANFFKQYFLWGGGELKVKYGGRHPT